MKDMQERKFVEEGIKKSELEEFLLEQFAGAGYSHSVIQNTPLSVRITVYAKKPGMVIGRSGKNIDEITEKIRKKFGIENPQLDVQEVENPNLDANIVARHIASSIERGLNYKRVANIMLQRIMESGAAGAAIRVSGKLGGAMGRTEKFSAGYLKFAGEYTETLVRKAYAVAHVKLGTIGIQVVILPELPADVAVAKEFAAKRTDAHEEGDVGEDSKDK